MKLQLNSIFICLVLMTPVLAMDVPSGSGSGIAVPARQARESRYCKFVKADQNFYDKTPKWFAAFRKAVETKNARNIDAVIAKFADKDQTIQNTLAIENVVLFNILKDSKNQVDYYKDLLNLAPSNARLKGLNDKAITVYNNLSEKVDAYYDSLSEKYPAVKELEQQIIKFPKEIKNQLFFPAGDELGRKQFRPSPKPEDEHKHLTNAEKAAALSVLNRDSYNFFKHTLMNRMKDTGLTQARMEELVDHYLIELIIRLMRLLK